MPFDCGLRTGVVQGSMPMSRSKDAVSLATKQEPLSVSHSMGSDSMLMRPKRFSTAVITRSCTSWLLMPSVVATWAIASRSQQSRAKATRTFSLLSQPISKPSEHHLMFDSDLTVVETIIDRSGVAHQ